MLIDCHTHAFADKIADKAVAQLINYYNIPTSYGGRLRDLLTAANAARLDALVLLVAATKPQQVKPANDWVLSLAQSSPTELQAQLNLPRVPRIIPFGTFHPEDPDWLTEVRRLKSAGIKGLKLHPEFQGIDLANPALGEFFEEVADELVLMIHIGDPNVSRTNLSTPTKVRNIIKQFPKLKIIAAHLGGYCFWEEVLAELAGQNLYFDTSSTLSYIPPGLFRQIVAKHGVNQVMFGSDYPLMSPGDELSRFAAYKWLTASEREQILGKNCHDLLEG